MCHVSSIRVSRAARTQVLKVAIRRVEKNQHNQEPPDVASGYNANRSEVLLQLWTEWDAVDYSPISLTASEV